MRTRNPHFKFLAVAAATLTLTAAMLPLLGDRAAARDRTVVVLPGDTLSQIALEEGLSVDALVEMNGLADPNRIFIGQTLIIRDREPAASAPAPVTHRVAYGETLSGIALRYGTTVTAIAQANAIGDTSYIRAGQVLTIPGAAATQGAGAAASKPASVPATHRVTSGETLWTIAVLYRTTVAAIAQANAIGDTSYIRAGQVLTIPAATAAASGSAARSSAMPASMAALVGQRQDIARLITAEAQRQGIPAAFALAVAWQESGWQPDVVSSAGAIGVMQLLPATADWVSATMLGHAVNLWDPASNVEAGVALLNHYLDRYAGSRSLVLAAYYQGQAATDRHGIYAITRQYIASILELERIFAG